MEDPRKHKVPIGTHYLAEIYSQHQALSNMKVPDLRSRISKLVKRSGFRELGRFYFRFKGGGITGIVSLRESHIAFHTWPEMDYLTLDVYTCNYRRNNQKRTEKLFKAVAKLFLPVSIKSRRILR